MRNTKSLLISVAAAALIAGGGYSLAQAPTGQAMPENKAAPEAAKPMEPKAGVKVDTKADTKAKASETKPMKSDSKADSKASDTKADSKSTTSAPASGKASTSTESRSSTTTTTGQGAAGTSASLTTEQRTRISTTIRQTNVKPLTNVTFSISVGTRVPRTVTRHRLPVTVIEFYPSWRGYEYILVGDEIIVINPRTLEIVAVISV